MQAMQAMQAIDIHSHVVPERFPAYTGVGRNVPWPSMAPAHACHCHVMIEGKVYRTVHQSAWRTDDRLAEMNGKRVAMQCLSPMPELLSYWLPAPDAQVLLRFVNDTIAEMVARERERFVGLGAVPLQDMDLALREVDYIVNGLGLAGVEIASHVNGVSIGDPRFEPFFARMVELDRAVFVHALRPAGQDRIVGAFSEQAVCFPGDIGLAAASMITGGLASRHPKLRIAFSHGGGVLAFLVPRITHLWNLTASLKEAVPESPLECARRFYYDSIVFDPAALAHLVRTFGATQVCAGSDFPFVMGDADPVSTIERAGFDPATLEAVVRGNAERYLGVALRQRGPR